MGTGPHRGAEVLDEGGTESGNMEQSGRLYPYLLAALLVLRARPGRRSSSLTEDRLWQQYKNALDEYHFQVDLNWRRSQYYFVLSAALLAAAISLRFSSDIAEGVILALFVASALVATFALFA